MPRRREMWERLGGHFDAIIIGGGINGAGIARDAARRGLRVAMIEMGDLASGTSSRSSKLVHGGLRYLEKLEFSLVFESVSERRILMDMAPHLVNPLGFIFPVYKGGRHKLWAIKAGMWLYEGLSLFRSPQRHRKLTVEDVKRIEPALGTDNLQGAPLYYDCATDDARLTLENALDAARAGAVVTTWAPVVSFLRDENSGQLEGVVVKDRHTGVRKEVRGSVIINATGPWTDRVIKMTKPANHHNYLRPTKGVHIVVDREKLPVHHAVVCNHPEDGRVLFAIPWGERTFIGTTDTDYDGDPADVAADHDDVSYLLEASNAYFPDYALTEDDVIATWAGLRPLIVEENGGQAVSESAVSREHQIVVGHDGLITIAGGKLTTYRRMAHEVVDNAVKFLRLTGRLPAKLMEAQTEDEPLPGAVGWPEDDDVTRVQQRVLDVACDELSDETALYLANTYGMRSIDIARHIRKACDLSVPLIPGRPEIMAQVDFAVDVELADTVSDFMMRRTQLYFRDVDQGLGALDKVADRMQILLDWDDTRRDAEVTAYQAEVARSRRWRDEP